MGSGPARLSRPTRVPGLRRVGPLVLPAWTRSKRAPIPSAADALVRTRLVWNDAEQVNYRRIVRIYPGEDLRLDEALRKLDSVYEGRCNAIAQFIDHM